MADSPSEIARKDLYALVWDTPMSKLGPRLGLSDTGLRKLCKRNGIPTPYQGYWQRRRHGKKVKRTPLPPVKKGQEEIVQLHRARKRAPPSQQVTGPVAEQREFEQISKNQIKVAKQLNRPHPLIKEHRDEMKARKRSGWNRRARPIVDIDVSKEARNRAFRIMSALFRALDKRGFKPRVKEGKRRKKDETVVTVRGEEIAFRLREKQKKVEVKPDEDDWRLLYRDGPFYDLEPSGRLVLEITSSGTHGGRKTWRDGKKQKLEDCLNSFVVGLVAASERMKEARRKREEWQRQREEEARRRREIQRQRELEQERAAELRRQVSAWKLSHSAREYVEKLRQAVDRGRAPTGPDMQAEEWLEWTEAYVEHLDPLAGGET